MTTDDFALVHRWLTTPEVDRWWGDPDQDKGDDDELPFEEALGDPNIALWIVSHGGRPFAYIQDYDPHAWANHHFASLPLGSRGIDQFIGEPDMLGCGHGSAFIRAHVERLFAQGAPAVGTDPHPSNARAIRAYEKAGFVRDVEQDTEWGRALLMVRLR
ncbi:GNAT family N-acetyltransferase [Gloeobacter morelensis]|nr:GNAT family N-acetyltransferase [Gloeobacter morelensis]